MPPHGPLPARPTASRVSRTMPGRDRSDRPRGHVAARRHRLGCSLAGLPQARAAQSSSWPHSRTDRPGGKAALPALRADWQRAQRYLHSVGRYDQAAMEPAIAPEMVAVTPRPAHTVRIVFADGEVRDVDITPLL